MYYMVSTEELVNYNDNELKEMRAILEFELHDVDMEMKYLKTSGEIPYNDKRTFNDVFIDRSYILSNIKKINKELIKRGVVENWMIG